MNAKYRGKSIETGEWFFGYYIHFLGNDFISRFENNTSKDFAECFVSVHPKSVGQFVGLDKNNKEIWSNSFVTVYFGVPSTLTATAKIIYTAQYQFVAEGIGKDKGKGPWSLQSKFIEVTDNPTLLEK